MPALLCFVALLLAPASAEVATSTAASRAAAAEGDRLYYLGQTQKSLSAYQKALKSDPKNLDARLSGSVALEELGQLKDAALWLRRAEALSKDPKIPTALGWEQLRLRDLTAAASSFALALSEDPKEPSALLGMARALSDSGRPKDALAYYDQAAQLPFVPNILYYWKGQTLEKAKDMPRAFDAYKTAVLNDSYFTEARYALGRAYMRANRFNEAFTQFNKMLDGEPDNPLFKSMRKRVLAKAAAPLRDLRGGVRRIFGAALPSLPLGPGEIPILRVGIGTGPLGKPLPRRGLSLRCDTPFDILDAKTGLRLSSGEARDKWIVRSARARKRWTLELSRAATGKGTAPLRPRGSIRIVPDLAHGGTTVLSDLFYGHEKTWSGVSERTLRGEIELSVARGGLVRVVDIVDLESYVHGVLSAEMPITSPLEALKAQSVVARSEALYMKSTVHRHRKEGYDLCDEQHCQVYAGVGSESAWSRSVVEATRGRVLAYHGRIAHGIYSSNCGGHTQSGKEISGWGPVAYWSGIRDAPRGPVPDDYPHSPWALRWWLKSLPPAYCMPTSSRAVHPSHYRWSRVVPVKELQERLNRSLKIGKLLRMQTLARAPSGHVNGVLLVGSRRQVRVLAETKIRNLLGLTSLRSSLFDLETEYAADRRPENFIFYGAGWGHGVGMCQSGAMGRAEQGQSYVDILRAYYPATELGNLNY